MGAIFGVEMSRLARSCRDWHLRRNEWLLPALVSKLSMPTITLYSWLGRGWVHGRQLDEPRRPWVIRADAQEIAKLLALRAAPKLGWQARTTMPIARA